MPSTAVDYSHSNAAPAAVTPPSFAGTGAAPAAHALTPTQGTGSAPSGVPHATNEGTGDAPDPLTIPVGDPTDSTPQLVEYTPIVPDANDQSMHTATLYFNGKLTLGQIFGLYKAPAAVVLKEMHLAAQTAPQGASAIIELVDADGVGLGKTATLPAGDKIAVAIFDPPLALSANTLVQAKVTAVGSTTAGGYLQATLVAQVIP
jgi:hypothetical protein